jgi:hypothetical protein
MTVGLALALGLIVGASLAFALFSLSPSPQPLRLALLHLHKPASADSHQSLNPRFARLARLAGLVGAGRLVGPSLKADLAITGHDETWLFSTTILLGVAGVSFGPAVLVTSEIAGVGLPWGIPVIVAVFAGAAAGLTQVLSLRSQANHRREAFSFALSAYLDLERERIGAIRVDPGGRRR